MNGGAHPEPPVPPGDKDGHEDLSEGHDAPMAGEARLVLVHALEHPGHRHDGL